ncbi:hypothetical protein ACRAWF_33300 [Streptomyces sp. L7]
MIDEIGQRRPGATPARALERRRGHHRRPVVSFPVDDVTVRLLDASVAEVERVRVLDGAVLVVSAVEGVNETPPCAQLRRHCTS